MFHLEFRPTIEDLKRLEIYQDPTLAMIIGAYAQNHQKAVASILADLDSFVTGIKRYTDISNDHYFSAMASLNAMEPLLERAGASITLRNVPRMGSVYQLKTDNGKLIEKLGIFGVFVKAKEPNTWVICTSNTALLAEVLKGCPVAKPDQGKANLVSKGRKVKHKTVEVAAGIYRVGDRYAGGKILHLKQPKMVGLVERQSAIVEV
jgi:hypothetical protein